MQHTSSHYGEHEETLLTLTRYHIMVASGIIALLIGSAFVAGLGMGKRAALSAAAIPETLTDIDDRAKAADMMFYGTLGDTDNHAKGAGNTTMQEQAEVVLTKALKATSAKLGEYTLHVSAVGADKKMDAIIAQLRKLGYVPVKATTEDGKQHIRVGRFESRSQAERAKLMVAKKNIEAEVLRAKM